MRWLVGWSSAATRPAADGGSRTVLPVGAQLLWNDPDPLWAVGDWRPDEVRVVQADPETRLAVFGVCGATDDQLRVGLFAARGGRAAPPHRLARQLHRRRAGGPAHHGHRRPGGRPPRLPHPLGRRHRLRHRRPPARRPRRGRLSTSAISPRCWPAPTRPRRSAPARRTKGSAGSRPATPWCCAAAPARSPPSSPPPRSPSPRPNSPPEQAVDGVRDALIEAVRARLAAPRHAPDPDGRRRPRPRPRPGMGPAERRAARGGPAPGIGADLSGGSASGTLALLAAGLPGQPGTLDGHGERLLAVTFNDRRHERRPALSRRPSWSAPAASPTTRGCGTSSSRPARRPSRTPTSAAARSPTSPGPPSSPPGATGGGCWPAARTTSSATAPARCSTPTRPGSPTCSWTAADAICCAPSPRSPRPTGPPRSPSWSPSPSTAPPASSPARPTGTASPRRRAASWSGSSPTAPVTGGAVDASLAALAWCRPGPAARWLTGEALAEVSVRLGDAASRSPAVGRPGERRARAALARHAADHRVFEQAAEVRNQRLHAPFLDNQVVLACRALPDTLRVQPGARAAVLRAVLAGAGVRDLPPGWGATSHATHAGRGTRRAAQRHRRPGAALRRAPAGRRRVDRGACGAQGPPRGGRGRRAPPRRPRRTGLHRAVVAPAARPSRDVLDGRGGSAPAGGRGRSGAARPAMSRAAGRGRGLPPGRRARARVVCGPTCLRPGGMSTSRPCPRSRTCPMPGDPYVRARPAPGSPVRAPS